MKGKVKFYNTNKGYGFIAGEDEKDVFFHMSALGEGVIVGEGDDVEYDVEEGDRGLKAVNVKKAI